jgi:hypothetical protein
MFLSGWERLTAIVGPPWLQRPRENDLVCGDGLKWGRAPSPVPSRPGPKPARMQPRALAPAMI